MIYDEYPHTIIFQNKEKVSDGMGGHTEGWVNLFTTPAHVQPITGQNRILAQQLSTPITTKVFYPYQEGARPGMRIQHGSQTLLMKSDPINQGGLNEVMMIECEQL